MITKSTLVGLTKNPHSESWCEPLKKYLQEYGITTQLQEAMFLAQTIHESGGFTILVENLNYSTQGLRKVFAKYFPTDELAMQYAKRPSAIANKVYANRMGNGDEQSGDGWKYRGRGIIQITGKESYQKCSQFLFKDDRLLTNSDFLTTIDGAIASACWFWTANNLNQYADKGDIIGATKRINGGTNGLDERKELYQKALILTK